MGNPCSTQSGRGPHPIWQVIASLIVLQAFASLVSADDDPAYGSLDETPSAFAFFREQAEQGSEEAQYNLAVMYETGWSVAVNHRQAVRWFREAARQGNVNAQLRLGMLYYLGLGARQSNIKGEKWIRKAAKQGHPLAKELNRLLFKEELPDGLSAATVMSRVRDAYLADEQSAGAVLASITRQAQRKNERLAEQKEETTIRERRAQRGIEGPVRPGFSPAQSVERIGSAVPDFISDDSVEKNQTLSRGNIATLRLQAERGLASAQYSLGRMYETGLKLPVDKKRAMEWYEKAARQGYADAEYRLGIALYYGTGPTRDEEEGKKWLRLAAGHGHPVAKNMMNKLDGEGVAATRNMSLAVRWYLERATQGDREAAFHLGKIYEHGWGVSGDLSEAFKWYRLAAQSGNEQAQLLVSQLQPRLGERKEEDPPSWLATQLSGYGLPQWLAHPLVIASIVLVIVWPLRPWRRKKGQTNGELPEP
ncbi:MAG TPA: sel1 repeat family protein [Gammaproteobacteria bacterium]|nr:sel1 repeat family protein [Gammaproteobacteria bacterium]